MIALIRAAQGYAGLDGRDHVLPDDIKKAAVPTLSHRIVFQNMFFKNGDPGADLILQILEQTPVPSEQIDFCRR